jgi:hypothetical protein
MSGARLAPSAGPASDRPCQGESYLQEDQDFLAPSMQSGQPQAGVRRRVDYGRGQEAQAMAAYLARPEYAHLQGYHQATDPGAKLLSKLIGEFSLSTLIELIRIIASSGIDKTDVRRATRRECLAVHWLVKHIGQVPAAFAEMCARRVAQPAARPPPPPFMLVPVLFSLSRPLDPPIQYTGDIAHVAVNPGPEPLDHGPPADNFDPLPDDPLGDLAGARRWSDDDAGFPPDDSLANEDDEWAYRQ